MVSNIVLNYYGKEVDIYPTQYGLGHRFHVFAEHGYAAARSPLILNLDDDVKITCKSIHKLFKKLRINAIVQKQHLSFSNMVSLSIERGASYHKNGDIQYLLRNGRGIALTPSCLLPLELMKFLVDVMPEEILAPIDKIKNCEDIMMNFASAFLNVNHASGHQRLIFANVIQKLNWHGLATNNTVFHRSSCIYWLDKVFRSFNTRLFSPS